MPTYTFTSETPPILPFPGFKWKWASLQCTEGLNDPVVLLGVLFRMRELESRNTNVKFSSDEFAEQMRALDHDIQGRGINVNLRDRVGERNLIRNSGQYWRALGLLPARADHDGVIRLTNFGRRVADRLISQAEFAATTIASFRLPNPAIQNDDECAQWQHAGLEIRPLHLLVSIVRDLWTVNPSAGYLTKEELTKIVIPLSSQRGFTSASDYAECIQAFRAAALDISSWPNCCPAANDHRIAREFLLFLAHYGYFIQTEQDGAETFTYNALIDDEIKTLLSMPPIQIGDDSTSAATNQLASDMERKRVDAHRTRPNQARFRRAVLGSDPHCIVTHVRLPEVLEAAHIVPYKYKGEDTVANGLCLRMDIHQLFDCGELRLKPSGEIVLSERARMSYGYTIPPEIRLPDVVNRDFVRWRWENYNGY
jgi:hypothetical protein